MVDHTIERAVDQLLMEQGHYTPLELLLAEGRLLYADYESWRSGELSDLAGTLFGDPKQCSALLSEADIYIKKLNFIAETLRYSTWGEGENSALTFSSNATFNRLFHTRYRKSDNIPQLDLFMDSSSTVLLNGICQSLIERNHAEARRQLDQLFDSDPGHNQLGALEQLVEAAEQVLEPVDDAAEQLHYLQQTLSPIAFGLLEGSSRHYLTPQWQRVTEALMGHPFDTAAPQLHCSYSTMQAMDWQQVIASIEAELLWQQQPLLLRRHAQASVQLHRGAAATSDWFLLCWRFPSQASSIKSEAESAWQQRWKNFMELEPELANEEFPAWALIMEPGLIKQLATDELIAAEPPEGWQLCLKLLQEAPENLMANRKALKGCSPTLFSHYLGQFNQ